MIGVESIEAFLRIRFRDGLGNETQKGMWMFSFVRLVRSNGFFQGGKVKQWQLDPICRRDMIATQFILTNSFASKNWVLLTHNCRFQHRYLFANIEAQTRMGLTESSFDGSWCIAMSKNEAEITCAFG